MDHETVLLCMPITGQDGDVVTTLSLRRITGADILETKRGGGSNADIELRQLSVMTGQSRAVLEELDCADYLALQGGYRQLAEVRQAAGIALAERDEEVLIPLWREVTVDGLGIKEITMRRPKVRDLLTAQKGAASDMDAELRRYCNLTLQPPELIRALDFADYLALDEAFGRFLSSRERMLSAR